MSADMTALGCFSLLALTSLLGTALAGAVCLALSLSLQEPGAWVCLAAGAVLGAAVAALALRRLLITPRPVPADPARRPVSAGGEVQKRLRHDIRGALSPALLTADRLLVHQDPAVQRAGDIVVRAVERASALLADAPGEPSPAPADANRPGDP